MEMDQIDETDEEMSPNPNPNPIRNPNVDPIYACAGTARTWNLVAITFKLISAVLLFCLALYIVIETDVDRETSCYYYDDEFKFMGRCFLYVSIFLFFSYCVSLYGIMKENGRVVIFWIVLLLLDAVGNMFIFIKFGQEVHGTPRFFLSLYSSIGFSLFYFSSGLAYLERIKAKNAIRCHRQLQTLATNA